MKRISIVVVLIWVLLALCGSVKADRSADCERMVNEAIKLFSTKGKDVAIKSIQAFNILTDKELYVFAFTMDNTCIAHPYRKDLVGKNLNDLKDSKGKFFVREFQRTAQNSGSGWVEYSWLRRGEKEPRLKRSFIKKVPGQDIYLGAGYYLK